jgi:hypothetical protein
VNISIVGKGSGFEDAPCEGEVWGITQVILSVPVSMVIDMNDYSLWGEQEAEDARAARLLAGKLRIPCIDRGNYPLKDIIDYFNVDYFSNTVDYALALAIFKGATEINLYGVNMKNETEYAYQKPGVEFWVGMAMGKGIKVIPHGEHTTILKTRDGLLYGYGTPQRRVYE